MVSLPEVVLVVLGVVVFVGAVFGLFLVITRGTPALFGSRRRLEADWAWRR